MEVVFYLNIVSPHQLPLARAVAEVVGCANFAYIYAENFHVERAKMGWDGNVVGLRVEKLNGENLRLLENVDLMYTGIRCFDLIASRILRGKKTVYYSERWFKPALGILRLLSPGYFKMARRFSAFLRNGEGLTYCPVGIHAARDMARLCGLMQGDLRCLFRAPKLEFERKPGGRIFLATKNVKDAKKYCLDKMRMWGYFVEPGSRAPSGARSSKSTLRVLWVGRMLKLKRVDTIIRAVGEFSKRVNSNSYCSLSRDEKFNSPTPASNSNSSIISLDIYGTGPEEVRLKELAAKYGDSVRFHRPVPIAGVRELMHAYDVYVFASDGYDGWGAVVSEALEEGMSVVGTFESGAGATMLPKERLYHCGDVKMLVRLLEDEYAGSLPVCFIGKWTAEEASKRLMEFA